MFTGLIADLGTVDAVDLSGGGARLTIATALASELADGGSVAVDGVCLTVATRSEDGFEADVMNQTLALTTLGGLERGSAVNLEPAMRAGDRFGGHIVQGHVDGVAEVVAVRPDGIARRVEVSIPDDLGRYVVEHGSIALDGISLTVANLTASGDEDRAGVEVSLIPETLERTTFGSAEPGRTLNVEVDLIARYAERLLQGFTERR